MKAYLISLRDHKPITGITNICVANNLKDANKFKEEFSLPDFINICVSHELVIGNRDLHNAFINHFIYIEELDLIK